MTALYPEDVMDVLRDAANIIDEHGLAKGSFHQHDYKFDYDNDRVVVERCEGYCVMGALRLASGWTHNERGLLLDPDKAETFDDAAVRRLKIAWAIAMMSAFVKTDIVGWNDTAERTKEEVVQALRECAARL